MVSHKKGRYEVTYNNGKASACKITGAGNIVFRVDSDIMGMLIEPFVYRVAVENYNGESSVYEITYWHVLTDSGTIETWTDKSFIYL